MELNEDTINKNSFFNHIFSLNEEEKGEMLNVAQYGALGLIPVLILNKLIQRFILKPTLINPVSNSLSKY